MDKFLRDENLKLYRKLLAETRDEERRRVLQQLISSLIRDSEAYRDT
ncbi:hypothetical protein [Rhodopseudomonas sp. B29]|nr:hypothetical protein [Rhodopseudomonas sp. B29]